MRGEKIQPQQKPTSKKRPGQLVRRRPDKLSGPTKKALTRAQCVAVVYDRARGRCERCGCTVRRSGWEGHPLRAHVNERLPRSRGGDPCDPANCELLCQWCHLPNGAHAPTVERLRQQLDGKGWLG